MSYQDFIASPSSRKTSSRFCKRPPSQGGKARSHSEDPEHSPVVRVLVHEYTKGAKEVITHQDRGPRGPLWPWKRSPASFSPHHRRHLPGHPSPSLHTSTCQSIPEKVEKGEQKVSSASRVRSQGFEFSTAPLQSAWGQTAAQPVSSPAKMLR